MIDYVGISYEEYDCWDLVALVYGKELQLAVGDRTEQALKVRDGEWYEVTEPRKFDVLVFQDHDLHKHVGMYLGGGKFLHSIAGLNSCIDRLNSSQWSHRHRKTYRHRQLM